MRVMETVFWTALGCIAYAYVGYPLVLAVAARLFGKPLQPRLPVPRAFSVVIAAYNESRTIHARVREILGLLSQWDSSCEVVVVSDGSTDATLEAAGRAAEPGEQRRLILIQLSCNQGKAAALNAGVAAATQPIVAFADARQTWNSQTLPHLLAPFSDPAVGAVSGDLVLQSSGGALSGVGLYWKIEKWLRRRESQLHSTIGATGAICAVRRELFVPLQPGTILDDVAWPVNVALAGHRVIHEPQAQAFDRLPPRARDEFRRKVRTLSGNLQLLVQQPQVLRPWRNPVFFGFLSKKLFRLVVPWAMLLAVAANAWIVAATFPASPWVYLALLLAQAGGYAVGLAAFKSQTVAANRFAAAASSLLVLNAAAFCAFWVWALGRSHRSWHKVVYLPQPAKGAAA